MIGYLFNSKIGALTHNIFHHKGLAILIYVAAIYLAHDILQFAGIILFSHASFDRVFGFGFKYDTSYNDTHLGSKK